MKGELNSDNVFGYSLLCAIVFCGLYFLFCNLKKLPIIGVIGNVLPDVSFSLALEFFLYFLVINCFFIWQSTTRILNRFLWATISTVIIAILVIIVKDKVIGLLPQLVTNEETEALGLVGKMGSFLFDTFIKPQKEVVDTVVVGVRILIEVIKIAAMECLTLGLGFVLGKIRIESHRDEMLSRSKFTFPDVW